jgi:hypothetical protein
MGVGELLRRLGFGGEEVLTSAQWAHTFNADSRNRFVT